jgi:hypothetical protein
MMWQRWFDYWMWQILGFSCIFGGEYPIVWLAWIPIPIRITKKIGKKWKKVIYQYLKMEKIEKTSIIPYPILSFCYTALMDWRLTSRGMALGHSDWLPSDRWGRGRHSSCFTQLEYNIIQPNQHVSRQPKT